MRCLAAARGADVQLRVGPAVELLDHEGEDHNVGVWVGALGFEGCGAGCGRLAKVDGDVGLRGGVEFVADGGRGDGCDGGEGGCRCCLLLVCRAAVVSRSRMPWLVAVPGTGRASADIVTVVVTGFSVVVLVTDIVSVEIEVLYSGLVDC
jgi:hypothetical protein